jgi:hypothetical protein
MLMKMGRRKVNSYILWVIIQIRTATVENNMRRFLKKVKIDPVMPLLGMYPKEMKSACQRDICTIHKFL